MCKNMLIKNMPASAILKEFIFAERDWTQEAVWDMERLALLILNYALRKDGKNPILKRIINNLGIEVTTFEIKNWDDFKCDVDLFGYALQLQYSVAKHVLEGSIKMIIDNGPYSSENELFHSHIWNNHAGYDLIDEVLPVLTYKGVNYYQHTIISELEKKLSSSLY